MKKITKRLVVPEDADTDEYYLAAMLQNAHAYGLGWCAGAFYRTASGKGIYDTYTSAKNAVSCCAVGALVLAPDTESLDIAPVMGNDSNTGFWQCYTHDDGESIGYAFRCALGEDNQ